MLQSDLAETRSFDPLVGARAHTPTFQSSAKSISCFASEFLGWRYAIAVGHPRRGGEALRELGAFGPPELRPRWDSPSAPRLQDCKQKASLWKFSCD